MPIPGRDVDAIMHPFGAAGLDKLLHNVAMAVLPRAVPDTMLGVLAGPEAETIVMLGGEDHPRDARGLGRCHPLACIQIRWIEQLFILFSIAPFVVGEGIHAKMDKCGDLIALPGDLSRRRPNVRSFGDDCLQRILRRKTDVLRKRNWGRKSERQNHDERRSIGRHTHWIPLDRAKQNNPVATHRLSSWCDAYRAGRIAHKAALRRA